MKRVVYLLISICIYKSFYSQLSGTLTVPSSSYTSLAAAITAINQQGTSGPLIININSGYTETAPNGGYSLTASGTFTAPIIFQKSGTGSNPLIIAYSGGTGTPGSMNQDGILRLIGCDFISIDGIDLLDTNSVNPTSMEFGYGLFKADASNGCWNNTIKNCVITLNRNNNASGSGPAGDGSRGIEVVNAVTNVHNSAITVTAATGSHSNNKFYANTIQYCNTAISLIGFAGTSPYSFADTGNEIGGNSVSDGNHLLNFGGGGTTTACAAIKTLAQYNIKVEYNVINNNTGTGIDHATTIRGIFLGPAASANATVRHNTLSLHGGGTNNQFSIIENASGSGSSSNTISIENNLILNSTYTTAVSPTYYGIWNSASPAVLSIAHNSFVNNSSHASGGSSYLIYNNGMVANSISINNNQLGFVYSGLNAYTGTMYSISNSNGTSNGSLNISRNNFSNYYHLNATATGNLYFINNTNDCQSANFSNNTFTSLNLNHSGSEYLIYNSSATQSLVSVCNNSIVGIYQKSTASGAIYGYYANGNSPAASNHSISANNFSNITATVSGSGTFYGIHSSDGSSPPYPKKFITNNVISNISINSTGNFYGYYLDNLGDASGSTGSEIFNNSISGITRSGNIYGLYLAAAVSPSYAVKVYKNEFLTLNTNGNSSVIYGAYLSCGGSGSNFYKNKISDAFASGTAAVVHGIYVTATVSNTLSTNLVGNLSTANSSVNNAINGIYVNSGNIAHLFYNTVFLNAISAGGNFNSNALYASSTVSLNLRNCILINTSNGGTGTSAVYRRSSTTISTYSSSSNNNLFYAGTPGSNNVILQSGTSSYQTLSAMQTALSPRDAASVTQSLTFLSLNSTSPNYLHVAPNISSLAESGASGISGLSDDIDNQVRHGNVGYLGSGSAPDIGADEFDQNLSPCAGANAGSLSVVSISVCAGQTIALFSNGYTPGSGVTHQWKVSTLSGGPYSNVSSGNGATTPEYFSAALNSGTYYFVLETTCTNYSVSAISQQATVVVNAIPLASASTPINVICVGQNLILSGTSNISGTYSWLGPNGFYSALQNPTLTNASIFAAGNYSLVVNANNCLSAPVAVSVNLSQVTLSLTANPQVLCSGNTSTINTISSANSYTWSNGTNTSSISVNPTISTVYSLAVTNTANCTASKQITISVISPSVSATGSVLCGNSGTVSLSVNAFTPSLVNWYASNSSTVSIHVGNTYSLNVSMDTTLYVEANQSLSGCSSLRIPVSVTLSPFPILNVTASSSVVCPGKTTSLSASGANTYSWVGIGAGATRTVNPNTNSTYTVNGKNSYNCASTKTIAVSILPSPTLTAIQSATSVCPSSVLGFTANGAITYTWNTGTNGAVTTVTPATSTSYTVYGSNQEGCVSSKTLAVSTRSVPLISIHQSADSLCPGQVIILTVSGANSYTWLPGGSFLNTFSIAPLFSSLVNVIGKSINTCTQVAFVMLTVDVCLGIESGESELSKCIIYPNPTSELIYIKFDSDGPKKILLFDALGQLIFEGQCYGTLESLNLSAFSNGIYLLRIETNQKQTLLKVIKE